MPDHWNTHAQQWQWIGSPLRPAPEDVCAVENALREWHARVRKPSPSAVLLGVTPEIARMTWPAATQLVAVDHTEAMIRALCNASAICANWTATPLARASQDIVVGDGCFSVLESGRDYPAMVGEVRRIMRDDGILVMRFFIRPDIAEPVTGVFDDLQKGKIGSFHAFKWRLAMALHGSFDDGVRLADVWDAWHGAIGNPHELAAQRGWRIEEVRTIDAYRGARGRYTFPTLGEARDALATAFRETACVFPGYELGERCPTLVLQPS